MTPALRTFRWYVVTRDGKRRQGTCRARASWTLFKRLRREFPGARKMGYWL